MKKPLRTHIKLALLLLITSISSQASAAHFKKKMYFGAGVSNTRLQINEQSIRSAGGVSAQSSLQNSQTGFSIFSGFRFDDYLSVELTYIDFGNYNTQTNGLKNELFSVDSLYLTSALNYPVSQNINSYIKLGFSEWQMDSKNLALQEDGTGLVYGAGVDINLYGSSRRTLKIEWLHQSFDDVFLSDSDSISASIVFSF